MKQLIMILVFGISANAAAFDKEDTLSVLQAALMESNKDYNENQKNVLHQDNHRIVDWSERENVTVFIEDGLDIESQYNKMDRSIANELSENFKQVESIQENNKRQEVSMNDF